jgi:hypothetical protein
MTPELLFEYIFAAIAGIGLGVLFVWFIAACFGFFDK